MLDTSKKNKRDHYLHSNSHATHSHATHSHTTPITRAPIYAPQQTPSMWENIKMGFGATMGSRIFNGIFGDPTVNVKVDPTAPVSEPVSAPAPAPASTRYNKCDYLKHEIKLHKCDNEEMNSNKCDDLFRQMYKCQHNL